MSDDVRAAAQALLNEAQPQPAFDQGDLTMFVMDVPDVPPQYAPIVVAQSKQGQQDAAKTDRTIGVCRVLENDPSSRMNSLSPFGEASVYLEKQEHVKFDWKATSWNVTLLKAPEHGALSLFDSGDASYHATDSAYEGDDRATVLVEIGAYKIKLMYFFKVMRNVPGSNDEGSPEENKTFCPKGQVWKISFNDSDPKAPIYTFTSPTQLTSALGGVFNANLTFADLPGEALGSSQGNTITLDTTAAGHGWFIDTTPWDNSEYIATSNPNEWIAKPGTDAAGKMDLLSVLLHE